MTGATTRSIAGLWRQSGAGGDLPRSAFRPAALGRPPHPLASGLHGLLDRLIGASSLVATDPVLDMRAFAWTALLRDHWRSIRDEAAAVARDEVAGWRSLAVWRHGRPVEARCPETQRLIATIPGLDSAAFSILAPGAHVPLHRGATKGLVTCHLGLVVPRDGDARMRVGDRVMRWSEGETLVFDDTYHHELWNEASGERIVLLLRFARPLRNPGKWIADTLLRMRRRATA